MNRSSEHPRLHPASLARALDLWALRREKVLELLDVRASREARQLADNCRFLAMMMDERRGEDDWQADWRRVRERALSILAQGSNDERRRMTPRVG